MSTTMPTGTRGNAQARSRNRHSDGPAVEVHTTELPSQIAVEDMPLDQEMEDDEQVVDEEDEEDEAMGESIFLCSSALSIDQPR